VLNCNSGGPDSVGGALCSKQFGPSNKTTNLQVSANTGPGNGLISEIFPDDFFENDTRLHGSTSLIINTDGSIHPYSQSLSQVRKARCFFITLGTVQLQSNAVMSFLHFLSRNRNKSFQMYKHK
jgi:hypothetical protein